MVKFISDKQLQEELDTDYMPAAFEAGLSGFPFDLLSDRDFEALVYLMIKGGIERGEYENKYSNAALMQGVGERGRDISLYRNDKIVGVVQCKNLKSRMNKPALYKEIIKFLLHSIIDEALLPDKECFDYIICASGDFSGPAIDLINEKSSHICADYSDIVKYVSSVIEENEAFSHFAKDVPLDQVLVFLEHLKIKSIGFYDLNSMLHNDSSLTSKFFKVRTVVDNSSLETTLRNLFDEYSLGVPPDLDVKKIQERIRSAGQENRIDLGVLEIFGYNRDFLTFLGGSGLSRLIESSAEIINFLNKKLIEYIYSKANELIFEYITKQFVIPGKVHPLSVSVASNYIMKNAVPEAMKLTMSNAVNAEFDKKGIRFGVSWEEIAEESVDSIMRFKEGDYSAFPNPDPDRDKRIDLLNHLSNGLNTRDDALRILDSDRVLLDKTIELIRKEIISVVGERQTILIKDFKYFDSHAEFSKILSNFGELTEANKKT